MELRGPRLDAADACERILRTLPDWFGIEESLLTYARATALQPTFAAVESGTIVAFVSLRQHFPTAWEVDCIAVDAAWRWRGLGRALMAKAEDWLTEQGATLLQVKTLADTSPDPFYAETRAFHQRLGYQQLEVFPLLWSPRNPCLLMVKVLRTRRIDLTELPYDVGGRREAGPSPYLLDS